MPYDPRQNFQGPGDEVTPGAQQEGLDAINSLTPDRISAGTAALQAELDRGTLEQTAAGNEINFQNALGHRAINTTERAARQGVISDALSRGIYQSGIRRKGEQEVTEQTHEARALLDRDTTMGLLNIQNMIQQLNSQFGLGLADFASQTVGGLEEFYSNQINQFGVAGSSGGQSGNRVYANRLAAQAGTGAYGARATAAQNYATAWSSRYGLETGQYRDWDSHPEGGSSNSDHYTGGAIDIMIDPNDPSQMASGRSILQELASLKSQGIVSGWIWTPDNRSNAHYNHIHVSFTLEGGGQNTNSTYVTGASSGSQMTPTPTAPPRPRSPNNTRNGITVQ